jgi:hypothetical protein
VFADIIYQLLFGNRNDVCYFPRMGKLLLSEASVEYGGDLVGKYFCIFPNSRNSQLGIPSDTEALLVLRFFNALKTSNSITLSNSHEEGDCKT